MAQDEKITKVIRQIESYIDMRTLEPRKLNWYGRYNKDNKISAAESVISHILGNNQMPLNQIDCARQGRLGDICRFFAKEYGYRRLDTFLKENIYNIKERFDRSNRNSGFDRSNRNSGFDRSNRNSGFDRSNRNSGFDTLIGSVIFPKENLFTLDVEDVLLFHPYNDFEMYLFSIRGTCFIEDKKHTFHIVPTPQITLDMLVRPHYLVFNNARKLLWAGGSVKTNIIDRPKISYYDNKGLFMGEHYSDLYIHDQRISYSKDGMPQDIRVKLSKIYNGDCFYTKVLYSSESVITKHIIDTTIM